MNSRASFFFSGIVLCINISAQDSLATDSAKQETDLVIEYSWSNDSTMTSLADSTLHPDICASPVSTETYTLIVEGPNPYVDTTTHANDPDTYTYPIVTFLPYSTGGWSWGSWSVSYFPTITEDWITIYEPYQNSLCGGIFNTTPHCDSSKYKLCATEPKQISSDPPAQTPEPAKPAPLPEQPWYQAILPSPIRIRKG